MHSVLKHVTLNILQIKFRLFHQLALVLNKYMIFYPSMHEHCGHTAGCMHEGLRQVHAVLS
jgi:hypothetical protein